MFVCVFRRQSGIQRQRERGRESVCLHLFWFKVKTWWSFVGVYKCLYLKWRGRGVKCVQFIFDCIFLQNQIFYLRVFLCCFIFFKLFKLFHQFHVPLHLPSLSFFPIFLIHKHTHTVVYNCFLRKLFQQRCMDVLSFCMQFEKRGSGLLRKAFRSEGQSFVGPKALGGGMKSQRFVVAG